MIIQPVPRDIRNIKAKFIGPFTKRQFFSIVPAAVLGLLVAKLIKPLGLTDDAVVACVAIIDAPILMCGFVDFYGMPAWVYFKDVVTTKVLAPADRPYATENTFQNLAQQNQITYEYFDGDDTEYSVKQMKQKTKANQKRLKKYLEANPDMKGIQ